ncbi:MAG: ABC transporter ATP-binding protein [Deltaproteobacteria bacterium]|jgi:oligopeptide/dipeptide ABC transporter ATP-binding protein|nr:ABC transporter ATP-binding protein [Deltaproteobacteria bacterium]
MNACSDTLLRVSDLAVGFADKAGLARAVDGVDFTLSGGRTFCLVGESGCGKSVTALALLHLLPRPAARVLSGSAEFEGKDLLALSEAEINRVRGARIGMIFQEPLTSLNPVFSVGEQVAEPFRLHRGLSRKEALREAVRLLELVGIAGAAQRAGAYPHELSGGMCQRVMIAMAVACEPKLLIADEPTTALDASLQNQILDLLAELREKKGDSLLLITHDLDMVGRHADSLAVMYSGKIVEYGPARELLRNPAHPYTQGLLASRPRFRPGQKPGRLPAIAGSVPSPLLRPPGCAFSSRCLRARRRCSREMPPLAGIGPGEERCVRCWLA